MLAFPHSVKGVGESGFEAALSALRNYGRIAMSGGIAGYNTPVPGPRNLMLVIGDAESVKNVQSNRFPLEAKCF